MEPFVRSKEPKEYRTMRPWAKTVDKFRAIAKHFNAPMTEILEHIANEVIKTNGIVLDAEKGEPSSW